MYSSENQINFGQPTLFKVMDSVQNKIKKGLLRGYLNLFFTIGVCSMVYGLFLLGGIVYDLIKNVLNVDLLSGIISFVFVCGLFWLVTSFFKKLAPSSWLNWIERFPFTEMIVIFLYSGFFIFGVSSVLNKVFNTSSFESWNSIFLLFVIFYTLWIIFHNDYDKEKISME